MQTNISGLFLLYKEAGMTSQTAVTRVKRLFGAAKAGHTGTLDPMAEGILPVLLGNATKASDFLLSADKHYSATLTLGLTSDTEDIWGNTMQSGRPVPCEEEVLSVFASFVGEREQVPPMYSALKIGGRKLCDLARQGVTVEREKRKITLYSLTPQKISDTEYAFTVHCSKGTYIRTLCADLGAALGCGGVMSRLIRLSAGGFSAGDALPLSRLEQTPEEKRAALLLPTAKIFAAWPKVSLPPFFARLARAGLPIYQKKIGTDFPLGTRVTFYDGESFFAVAEACMAEEGEALKPVRQFPTA